MDFTPFDPEAETERWSRHLPHWEQEGCTYFVTFRLGDSIPAKKLEVWRDEKARWEEMHPKPWKEDEWRYWQKEFLERIERWTDQGYGACYLRQSSLRAVVSRALEFFAAGNPAVAEVRYDLFGYIVMPNHVHLLVKPRAGRKLGDLTHSWKSFSSKEINRQVGRGGPLWMDERFDHLVRSDVSLERFQEYIAENPRQAGLKQGEFTLWRM